MVRFMFKSLLGHPFTSGTTVCTANRTYSLALWAVPQNLWSRLLWCQQKGSGQSIVGSSLIFLGLTSASCPWCGSNLHKGRERSQWLSSLAVPVSTALLFCTSDLRGFGAWFVVNAGLTLNEWQNIQINKYPSCLAEGVGSRTSFTGTWPAPSHRAPLSLSAQKDLTLGLIFCCCLLEILIILEHSALHCHVSLVLVREEGIGWSAGNYYFVSASFCQLLPGANGWECWLCVATSSDFSKDFYVESPNF